ncbi:hypothetical protein GFU95_07550 [Apibacter sp. B3889]|uniref:hypothetical protein n=1 Tax=unclassified Apibacter TaxID=2630820 RepID=UPI001324474C|nr:MULTISPECIES: hypothetical protein [unclassified Apibacter]MXO32777.1 hypothetical protein [Apibacter sp. B2912]MXO34673.1 hypothetical protein [Apibacter sp. B3883]MXO42223.1 hypothetical protein [Apibacter sp. B3889]MXP03793.1 hypothetical protein [Apibacter sp. B3887]MXP07971.1 hypothetical protein [Apibacter sp. B3935]
MNKIYLTICILLLATGIGISQKKAIGVGINTDHPQAIFHIDAKKDNGDIPNPVNTSDDVVFTTEDNIPYYGKVGVGKINPDVSLDINGNIRLEDGHETNANILVSIDSLGNSKWVVPSRPLIKTGKIGDNIPLPLDESAADLTEQPVILSQGRWLILSKFVIKPTVSPPNEKPRNNVWIYLKNVTKYPDINKKVYNTILGVPLEQDGGLDGLTGTPQLAALVNIPKGENHEFRIFGSTSNVKFGYVTSNTKFQGSFFYAVRLDADLID